MYLNHSRASMFRQCQRKWALTYFVDGGLKPKHEDDKFLIGSAVHKGLEVMALNLPYAADTAADHYTDKRCEHWEGALLAEWKESADLIHRMVQGYQDREYPKDDFSIVSVEKRFAVQLALLYISTLYRTAPHWTLRLYHVSPPKFLHHFWK